MKNLRLILTIFIGILFTQMAFSQGAGVTLRPVDPGPTDIPTVLQPWKWVNTSTGIHWCYNGSIWENCAGDPGTDDQNITGLNLSGTTLTVEIENGNPQSEDLSPLQDGNDIDYVNNVQLNGTTLEFNGVGNATDQNVDLSSLQDGTGTDDQNLSVQAGTATTSVIDIEDGTDVTIQAGSNITLSESGNTITIDAATGSGADGYFRLTDVRALNDGRIQFEITDANNNISFLYLTNLEDLPRYDTQADADAALPPGRLWLASENNLLGENPGDLNATF